MRRKKEVDACKRKKLMVKGGKGAYRVCAKFMKRFSVILLVLVLCSAMVFADDLRLVREDVPNKHLVGPHGIYMMLSHYNRNITREVQGYESELSVFTPEFKENILIYPNAIVGIFVVKNDTIEEILPEATTVPQIPADGYLVVGHGRAAVGFMAEFEVGDKVSLRDYTPSITAKNAKEVVIMPNGDEILIGGYDRGRCADEVVIYTSDYADRTYTNEWGIEIVVEDDEVYEIRQVGNTEYMEIPKKGFVISGHGSMIAPLSGTYEGDFIELD
jgi:hypothetical protein